MSLIDISNLTFAYDGSWDNIFENVSFQIDTDWKLGFIGRNGRGKTTFLNLLLGKYEYKGNISASVTFDYFPFEVADKENNTIDIAYSIYENLELWQLHRELSLLNVCEDVLYRPFCTLSNGEQTKVLLACLFLKENNFLLIDEPTNHLDITSRNVVSDYLKNKKGYILVSHDRTLLNNCIDHVLSINKTNIEIQKGNFSSWWHNKQMQDNFELAQNKKLKKEINQLSASAKRTKSWSDKIESSKIGNHVYDRGFVGHKAAKMMKRSKAIESRQQDAINEKSKLLKNIEDSEQLCIKPINHHSDRLIEVNGLSIFYDNKVACKDINFAINNGDRIALKGANGSGKSSILKLLMGEDISYSGNVYKAGNIVISYVPQDTSFLKGSLKDFIQYNEINEPLFKAILRKLGFSRTQFEKDMQEFSSGQKKKVVIAKSLAQRANLYIWDEPLNFIDVISCMQIESLIIDGNPTMLFVEHDSTFVENICTSVVTL